MADNQGGKLNAWQLRQQRDTYVKRAVSEGYRSRASFKLIQIQDKYGLIQPGHRVVDLGAAPGGWCQVARNIVGSTGKIIAVDRLPMEGLAGIEFIEGDFAEQETVDRLLATLGGEGADLVFSDMAPNFSGVKVSDQARSLELAELTLELAEQVLSPDGAMVVKCFEGAGIEGYRRRCRESFQKVSNYKPPASRKESREFYLVARTRRV